MAQKFRKKPVVIDAVQWAGTNKDEIVEFAASHKHGRVRWVEYVPGCLFIATLEGEMRADLGDWIIRGPVGEFYPCKPDIFAMTYEAVTE